MKTNAEHRAVLSSSSARLGAGVLAVALLASATTLPGCAKPREGGDYHSDIDHNGQPFDEFFPSGDSKDAKSDDTDCCREHDKTHDTDR